MIDPEGILSRIFDNPDVISVEDVQKAQEILRRFKESDKIRSAIGNYLERLAEKIQLTAEFREEFNCRIQKN